MKDSEFWKLVSANLNGSEESEIKAQLSSLFNIESEEVSVDLIENIFCHFELNCTKKLIKDFSEYVTLHNILNFMENYYLPCIIFMGMSGNAVSIVVFILSKLRLLAPATFLGAIAVVDFCFLLSLLLVWLEQFHFGFHTSEGLCQLIIYVSYVCTNLSVWYLTALSVERFLVFSVPSCHPDNWSSVKTKVTLYGLTFFACVMSMYLTWTSGIVRGYGVNLCTPLPQYIGILNVVTQVETIVALIIPYVFVCLLNCLTLRCLVAQSRLRHSIIRTRLTGDAPNVPRVRRRCQLRITKLSLVVSLVSVTLSAPCHVLRLWAMFLSPNTQSLVEFTQTEFLWQKLFQYCFYTKASINFVMYLFLARSFRKALKALLFNLAARSFRCSFRTTRTNRLGESTELETFGSTPDSSSSLIGTNV